MTIGEPKMPDAKELSEIKKERIISDAELVKRGADVTAEGKITPTDEQIETAKIEMDEHLYNELHENESGVPGMWLKVDNMETVNFISPSQESIINRSEDPKDVKKYSTNNGIIAFVTSDGEKFVGPQTKVQIQALEDAGYMRGDLNVPMSSGTEPKDIEQKRLWKKMNEEGDKQFEKEKEDERLARFHQEEANKNN